MSMQGNDRGSESSRELSVRTVQLALLNLEGSKLSAEQREAAARRIVSIVEAGTAQRGGSGDPPPAAGDNPDTLVPRLRESLRDLRVMMNRLPRERRELAAGSLIDTLDEFTDSLPRYDAAQA